MKTIVNNINMCGLTKEEYIQCLKDCGMCTKKWTPAKMKEFHKRRLEIISNRKKDKKHDNNKH